MNQTSAQFFIWLADEHASWDLISPDDWYEAMATIMAERGPA